MYVYVQSERAGSDGKHRWGDLWTVGFYKPDGSWVSESDHASKTEAADRVAYLNGYNPSLDKALTGLDDHWGIPQHDDTGYDERESQLDGDR